jgi:hypothetical protein
MARVVKSAALPWELQFHGGSAFDGQNETPLGFLFCFSFPPGSGFAGGIGRRRCGDAYFWW